MISKSNLIVKKSTLFALRIINLYKYMQDENREFIMSKQILKSGTSIGANITESIYAQSTADFISKLSIALKEAGETEYWLELLYESNYLPEEPYKSILKDCTELIKLLTSIIKTTKEK